LTSPLDEESTPALRAIGNILSSTNPENIDLFLFHGGLSAFNHLMTTDQSIQKMKELLWSCSNITAGTEQEIITFINHKDILDKILLLMNSSNIQVRREAVYVITNILTTMQNQTSNYNLANYDNRKILGLFVQGLKINDA